MSIESTEKKYHNNEDAEKQRKTVEYYEQNADEWWGKYNCLKKESYWKQEVEDFSKHLSTGKILEIGFSACGEAALLIEKGYDYTGIDAAKRLVEKARARGLKGEFLHHNLYDITQLNQKFDGFLAVAILVHIPKNHIEKILKDIRKVLHPGAIGFISVLEGEGDRIDEKTKRLFVYYHQDEFAELLEKCGFEVIEKGRRFFKLWEENLLTFFVRNKEK